MANGDGFGNKDLEKNDSRSVDTTAGRVVSLGRA